MPVVVKKDINNSHVRVAQVLENEGGIDQLPKVDQLELQSRAYKHEHHKNQFILSRLLVKHIVESKLDQVYSGLKLKDGVPEPIYGYVPSISHSGKYVAVVLSNQATGIDVQRVEPKIDRVIARVCCQEELDRVDGLVEKTIVWSVKEALYKRAKKKGLQFNQDLIVEELSVRDNQISGVGRVLVSDHIEYVNFEGVLLEDYVVVYTL